jgi:predicted TIM-barrel fold metal-dependent hydrolase
LTLGRGVGRVLDEHLAVGDGRFRGIRFSTGWDPSPEIRNTQAAKRPRMLAEREVRAGLTEVESRGLSFDAWLFHTQLGEVADLADALPGLIIVIDHCGGPLGYGPYSTAREEHFKAWRRDIRNLAHRPNVYCKIGGLLARGAAFDYLGAPTPPTSAELAAIWGPWITECAEAFGADRCMFESNFPVDKMGVPYTTLWNAFKISTRGASDEDRRAMFFGTAQRAYRLDVAG